MEITINPTKFYSKNEILALGVLGKTEATVRKKVLQDRMGPDILQTETSGEGNLKRYKILGANLIKYIGT